MAQDRQASLLTERQREFLRDDDDRDLSDRGKRAARARIRDRVRQGLLDFNLLQQELSDDEIERISTESGPDSLDDFGGEKLAVALRSTVAIVYRMADTAGLNAERVIDDGIVEGKQSRAEVIRQKLEDNPNEVTIGELNHLEQSGEVSPEETMTQLLEKLDQPTGMIDPDDPPEWIKSLSEDNGE